MNDTSQVDSWRIEGKALITPFGQRIALHDVLQWRANLLQGNADLTGKWSGWRVSQQWLIPPGGSIRSYRIAQHVLAHEIKKFNTQRIELSRRQLALLRMVGNT